MSEDLILDDEPLSDPCMAIENSCLLMNSLVEIEGSPYDEFDEHRIKAITNAFKVIKAAQDRLIKEMKG